MLGTTLAPGLTLGCGWVLKANTGLGSLTCDQAGDDERQH